MLILILIDVPYSHKAVFSFEKGHFSSCSFHPVKNSPSKISDSPPTSPQTFTAICKTLEMVPSIPSRREILAITVKKHGIVDIKLFLYSAILLDFSLLFQIF